jgi:hypothetical protein
LPFSRKAESIIAGKLKQIPTEIRSSPETRCFSPIASAT